MNERNITDDTPNAGTVTPEPAANGGLAVPTTASLKQIAANRANALKSTGPRTPRGLAVSKMNALKSGIWSREVLVRGWHLRESGAELAALLEEFRISLNPVGPIEDLLVQQIVTASWRLRRVLRAESGEISLSVDGGRWERSRHLPHWHWMDQPPQAGGKEDPVSEMKTSAGGLSMLADWLRDVRDCVENEGELTVAAVNIPFFGRPNKLSAELERLRLLLSTNADQPDPASQRQANKLQALRAIDLKLESLQLRLDDCQKREEAEEAARQASDVLPKQPMLDKIMRYETTLNRQLFRAMSQLERLQRLRQGETVPAPMILDVSEKTAA
jgi:hypothetical protein